MSREAIADAIQFTHGIEESADCAFGRETCDPLDFKGRRELLQQLRNSAALW